MLLIAFKSVIFLFNIKLEINITNLSDSNKDYEKFANNMAGNNNIDNKIFIIKIMFWENKFKVFLFDLFF